jgi:signal transduction histidine kinase
MIKRIIIALVLLTNVLSGVSQDTIIDKKINPKWVEPEVVFDQPLKEQKAQEPDKEESTVTEEDVKSLANDKVFLENLPKSYEDVPKEDLKKLAEQIEQQIQKLIQEKEMLLQNKADESIISAKETSIKSLSKEKEIVDLSIENDDLTVETKGLKIEKAELKKYLIVALTGLSLLVLAIVVLLQRKTIKVQDIEIEEQLRDIHKKNTYLEHAARIIRHDMHSGINTYMPRGIGSLEKRLSEEEAKRLKIDAPIKMIKEGLSHTQRVYKSVYEFTNLVKKHVVLNKKEEDLEVIIKRYLDSTSYSEQVSIGNLIKSDVNEILFCTAIDNLVRNGLKYNDSESKEIKIYMDSNYLVVEDNGRGLKKEDFEKIVFMSKDDKHEEIHSEESGLGLNICLAILSEHGFTLECEEQKVGTKMKIIINK